VANPEEDDRLEALWDDLLVADLPDPGLMARHVRSPNELAEDERAIIDAALSTSAAARDELDTLQGFDFSLLNADLEARKAAGIWPVLRQALFRPLTLSLAGGLAALVTWLAVDLEGGPNGRPGSLSPPPDRFAATDRVAPPVAPADEARARVEETLGGEAPLAAERPVEQLAAAAPAPLPADSAGTAGSAETTLPQPAPVVRETVIEPEMLLAMNMPVYERPSNAMDRFFDVGGYRSASTPRPLTLAALVPAHTARAGTRAPRLFWSVDALPDAGAFYFSLVSADADAEVVVDGRPLDSPASPGVQSIDLAAMGISLDPDREYRWSVSHRPGEWEAPTAFAQGSLTYVPPAPPEADRLAGAPEGERAALLAGAGYWYDALAVVLDLAEAHPEDPRPRQAARMLLEQAGHPGALD
jgi:hypothetical protein